MGSEGYFYTAPAQTWVGVTSSYPTWTYNTSWTETQPVKRPVGWLTRAARRTNKRPL